MTLPTTWVDGNLLHGTDIDAWPVAINALTNALTPGLTSTVTSAVPFTLVAASPAVQVFTGTIAQTVNLATTSVVAGAINVLCNRSTALLSANASGGGLVATLGAGDVGLFIALVGTPTTAAGWQYIPFPQPPTTFEYIGAQTLTNQPVPIGATGLWIERMISSGSGGGSGRRGAALSIRCGGGGGGPGGATFDLFLPISRLGTTWSYTASAAGAGGAAVTVNDTNGNNGAATLGSLFTSGPSTVQNWQNVGAGGGTNASGTAGLAGQGGMNAQANGAAASVTGGVGAQGGSTYNGTPCGGGAGGGITNADVAGNGGASGWQLQQYGTGVIGGAGVVGGATPTAGTAAVAGICGVGGGGGAASITTAAQAGATATGYGAGGGGGGASLNGNNSGKGGDGGPAYFRGRWIFE